LREGCVGPTDGVGEGVTEFLQLSIGYNPASYIYMYVTVCTDNRLIGTHKRPI